MTDEQIQLAKELLNSLLPLLEKVDQTNNLMLKLALTKPTLRDQDAALLTLFASELEEVVRHSFKAQEAAQVLYLKEDRTTVN